MFKKELVSQNKFFQTIIFICKWIQTITEAGRNSLSNELQFVIIFYHTSTKWYIKQKFSVYRIKKYSS